MFLRRMLPCAAALCCAFGQEFRASLSGTVTDPSGSAIANAAIAVVNLATNTRATAVTSAEGLFALPQLSPGAYELTAEAPGFRKYLRQGITLGVGDKASLQVRMEVGELAESVTVSAELMGIESSQSVMGQLMDTKKVSELPLNGRQVFMLLQLSAGVVFTQQQFGSSGFSGTRAWDTNGSVSIHGSRTGTNGFMLDGAPLGVNGSWDYAPLVDAVEEFKVTAAASDASQGLTGGGVINMTMKSGTNQIHGLASEFIRNNIFDALSTQTKRSAAQRPDLLNAQHQWNSYAALISGQLIKNKLFYSGHYEGFQERVPFPITVTIPTLAQRAGDFSRTFNASNQLVVIYDPLTTRQSGSAFVRDAFPGNRIPANRIVPVANNLMKFVPAPNITTNPVTEFNNFASSPNIGEYGYNAYYVKTDYIWNEKHRTFGSETQNFGSEYRSGNGLPRGNPAKTGNDPLKRDHQAATLDHVWSINTSTVLNARLAWDRYISYSRQDSVDNFDGSALGFKGRIGSYPVTRFPNLTFTDYTTLATSGRSFPPNDAFSFVADISKTLGRHFLKFGTRDGQARFSRNSTGDYYGRFDFNKGFTQRNPQSGDNTSGHAIANFLLGYPSGGGTDVNPQSTYENKFFGFYIQDDWKLNNRLTVNIGLRWDVQTSPTERYNRIIAGFDPNAAYTLGAGQAKGGFVFADDKHRQPWSTHFRDFQPRFGVAYQATPKMVWRAGYGLSYLPLNGTGGQGGISQNGYSRRTNIVPTIGGGLESYIPGRPGTGTLEIPYPEGILQPFGVGLGPRTQVGQSISYTNPAYVLPRVHQFNIGFEYELPWKMTAEISFVGSRTVKYPVNRQTDAIPLAERLKGFADPNYLNASVPNPFAGAPELLGTGLAAATITRSQSMRPFPQFTGLTINALPIGDTTYNGLETRFNKRLSAGLTMTAAYTYSKTLEKTDFREDQYTAPYRVLADFDRTHHLTWFALYDLPFGRGKWIGSGWSRGLDLALGHWQYNFMIEAMNGTPTAMPDATPIRDPRLPNKTFDRWYSTCTLLTNGTRSNCASADEPIAWVQLKPNELRTYSTRFPNLRNDWRPQINMSLFKTFPVSERIKVEFRAETFNAFNTPIYRGPDNQATTPSITSANFGVVIRDQQNFPRNMQFALRVRF